MSASSSVTVVIITRDRCPELLRTLDMLRRDPGRPRVLVVDNGSSDGTAQAVADRAPGVTVLCPGRNLGATARNLGVATAETPYVAFCDDDTWWEPGCLARAAQVLEDHPRLAVVTGRIIVEPGGDDDPVCDDMGRSPLPDALDVPGRPLLSFLAGASMVRRSAFLGAGGFHPRFFFGGEEELLGADLVTAGWALSYLEDVVVHHQASTSRDSHHRRRQGIRNTLWFTWLRRPLRPAIRRTVLQVRRLPRDRVTLLALVDAVAGVAWVARERRVVPPAVERDLRSLERAQLDSDARRYVS